MSRPDPIEYAERLYSAIRAANFSPMSFLAFGNAVKDGVAMRSMPRIAAEPFMRIVGEMLDLEETVEANIIDAETVVDDSLARTDGLPEASPSGPLADQPVAPAVSTTTPFDALPLPPVTTERRRDSKKR